MLRRNGRALGDDPGALRGRRCGSRTLETRGARPGVRSGDSSLTGASGFWGSSSPPSGWGRSLTAQSRSCSTMPRRAADPRVAGTDDGTAFAVAPITLDGGRFCLTSSPRSQPTRRTSWTKITSGCLQDSPTRRSSRSPTPAPSRTSRRPSFRPWPPWRTRSKRTTNTRRRTLAGSPTRFEGGRDSWDSTRSC